MEPSGDRSIVPPDASTLAPAADTLALDEPRILVCRCGRSCGPRVRPQVVMVATCRQEQCAGVAPDDLVEPERFVIERGRLLQIADVQMHVAHPRAVRHAGPALHPGRRHEILHVERDGRHLQLAAGIAPVRTRPIGVHLDPQSVGIGEVERLAHEMIRHAGIRADLRQMTHEPPERCAIRKQNREVEQSELPALRMRTRARLFVQLDDRRVVADRAECGTRVVPPYHAKAQDAFVVGERSRHVRNLQPHDADSCGGGQPKPRRRDASVLGLGCVRGHANGFW
jgi:hypothetical protein